MEMTQLPDHNQKRKHEKFDFRMNVIGDIMFDILFTKDKVCISDNGTQTIDLIIYVIYMYIYIIDPL